MPIAFSKLFDSPDAQLGLFHRARSEAQQPYHLLALCGKVLGGCSAINGLSYIRGHSEWISTFVAAVGNAGLGLVGRAALFPQIRTARLGPLGWNTIARQGPMAR